MCICTCLYIHSYTYVRLLAERDEGKARERAREIGYSTKFLAGEIALLVSHSPSQTQSPISGLNPKPYTLNPKPYKPKHKALNRWVSWSARGA